MDALVVRPVTSETWPDLEEFFGPGARARAAGACFGGFRAGSSVRWWDRVPASGCGRSPNRTASLPGCSPTGTTARVPARVLGWCTVAPRERYRRILRSPNLRPDDGDEAGIWSVPCFYIRVGQRRGGVGRALLAAAVRHAEARGARAVEGYPVDPSRRKFSSAELYTGTVGMFAAEGFQEVLRR